MNFNGKYKNETKCPRCGEKFKVSPPTWVGQPLDCPACDAVLEVYKVKPVLLRRYYLDEEKTRPEYT